MHSFEVHSNESACRKVDVLDWNKSYTIPFRFSDVVGVGEVILNKCVALDRDGLIPVLEDNNIVYINYICYLVQTGDCILNLLMNVNITDAIPFRFSDVAGVVSLSECVSLAGDGLIEVL